MRRLTALLTAVFIFAGLIFLTGCSDGEKPATESDIKELTDCMKLTQSADSMEVDVSTETKEGGESVYRKMHMKMEGIKSNLRSELTLDLSGVVYLGITNGNATLYVKDSEGKYTGKSTDASQLGFMEVTKSFNTYINILEKNINLVKKIGKRKYRLYIPEDRLTDIYSKISGKQLSGKFDSLFIDFKIGNGYLKNFTVNGKEGSTITIFDAEYNNFNEKFNIVLPSVY
ncbi:MAG TPA: hypothetical protein VHT34_12050 [Clostridia bacterium]|nr:hypothetical protein [Clostridia bacterium]